VDIRRWSVIPKMGWPLTGNLDLVKQPGRAWNGALHNPTLATRLVLALTGAKLLIHLLLSGRYGYFRDELYYLACGRHLAWGYVDHAPTIGLVARIALLLGGSLHVLRAFPAVAGALLVALTMLIAWRLGGNRFAQGLAGLSIIFVPIYSVLDSILTMNAFEPLFWMGCVYVLIRIMQTGNSRLWIWFGVLAGLGLMNKHSTAFFGLAVAIGLILSKQRRELARPWVWIGAIVALLIFAPNLIWQMQHHFPTIEDLHNVRVTHKNVELPPLAFIQQQILVMGPVLFPVWLAGLWHFMWGGGTRYRLLGWIFLTFFAMMILLHGKDYYVAPIYPMLLAGGAVAWEGGLGGWRLTRGKLWPKAAMVAVITAGGLVLAPLMLPFLSPEQYIAYQRKIGFKPAKQETHHESLLPQPFADQFGWPELVEQVAQVYNSLPPEERSKTGVIAGNYGEAGAVDFFGPKYGLPPAISNHQTYWYWGPPKEHYENFIVLQWGRQDIEENCKTWQAYEHYEQFGMGEENTPFYFCRGAKFDLRQIWPHWKHWN
jgi:Dolichyl-phosphate-mannose-protein mannosyltransferase